MKRLSAVAFALALSATLVHAQTTTTPGTTPAPTVTDPAAGSFDKLSHGNQRIATAIFEAQKVSTPPVMQTLTLDQIAYRKLSDQGWGVIYKDLLRQGLVTEKNLGQTMKAYNDRHHSEMTASNTAAGRDGQRSGKRDEPSAFARDFMRGSGPGSSGHGGGNGHGPGGNSGHSGGMGHGGGHGRK